MYNIYTRIWSKESLYARRQIRVECSFYSSYLTTRTLILFHYLSDKYQQKESIKSFQHLNFFFIYFIPFSKFSSSPTIKDARYNGKIQSLNMQRFSIWL